MLLSEDCLECDGGVIEDSKGNILICKHCHGKGILMGETNAEEEGTEESNPEDNV